MHDALYLRAAALYLPIVLALLAGMARTQPRRQFAATLLSLLWALPMLAVLQRVNQLAHWWSYATDGPRLVQMPLELYLGWAVLWGVLPQLGFRRLSLRYVAAIMVAADVLAMPRFAPVVVLGTHWLAGEAVAVAIVLLPSLAIARWTLEDVQLPLRATLQVAMSALLFLYLVPEIAFALRPGPGWNVLLQISSWERQLWLQIVLIAAIPGVAAVMEFAQRGKGTPIPYDPPKRLVTSGIYRYVANPMQLSCAVVMVLWAAMLRCSWLLIPATISIVYSAGIAEWDESGDLSRRFGQCWLFYRVGVRNWLPRWRPYHVGPHAILYVASTCGPCSELRRWIERRSPVGLQIVAAETRPAGSIERLRYDPGDSSAGVEGVRAAGRALEHLNLGWTFAGAALRLPIIWQFVQMLLDASGLGPRTLPAFSPRCESSPRSS